MKRIRTLFLLAVFALTATCKHIDGPASNVFQTWEVKNFVSVETVTYDKKDSSKILLSINSNNTFTVKLDVNACTGSLAVLNELNIIFNSPLCTEACCDSPFAERFAELLPYITMYKIDDNMLRLSIPQWGFIECVQAGE